MAHIFQSMALASIVFFSACSTSFREGIFLEAESFSERGGWVTDQQFCETVGSPYLLAHGAGVPVEDASTSIILPHDTRWHVYVRTYNWTSPWKAGKGPGGFEVSVDGKSLGKVCGRTGECWEWQYAGSFRSDGCRASLSLHDLSGFDGRCDAVYITSSRVSEIERPDAPDVEDEGKYDFVVVGGGVAGMCAAVSASRLGLKVALVHDRPVLGGNNSSEVRVHLGGEIELDPYPNLGNTMKEWGHTESGNACSAENYQDWKKDAFVAAEKRLTLFAPYHFAEVETADGKISSIVAFEINSGRRIRLEAPLFADCTGDASLGFKAGADFSYGREARSTYGEPSAPEKEDRQVLGASVQWNSRECSGPTDFPVFEYGIKFTDESARKVKKGEWTWETGMFKDMILDAERIRDYGMLIVYSNWSYLKHNCPEFACSQLDWVAYIAGKRESRRLLGDVVVTENDVVGGVKYPDGTATSSWSIDLHYPDPENTKYFPGKEFLAVCEQTAVDYFPIPYRSLYSRNVGNLLMAGRDISVSHIALGTTRVMRTTAMEGEVIGMAAAVCRYHRCSPRGVYEEHFDDLQALMREGIGDPGLPNNQQFNRGHKSITK